MVRLFVFASIAALALGLVFVDDSPAAKALSQQAESLANQDFANEQPALAGRQNWFIQ
jgi:hypothetical protein